MIIKFNQNLSKIVQSKTDTITFLKVEFIAGMLY